MGPGSVAMKRPEAWKAAAWAVGYHRWLMNSLVKNLLQMGAAQTDAALERLLPGPETLPHSIHRAMRHSTFAGGKRLRPILCLEAARMTAAHGQAVLPSAEVPEGAADLGAALEMLHTYSLIHDDLPALDNDDLRRGQPTCHIIFGEATAILAGDALQTLAFQTIANLPSPAATTVRILREVAAAVGTGVGRVGAIETGLPPGMIGGQVMDLEGEHQRPTAEMVEAIHRAKTGALITVSIVAGGLYGAGATGSVGNSASEDTIGRLRRFGQRAGLAFQIVDDVLDMTEDSAQLGKTAGKDTASDKATWPAVYGIDRSLADAKELIADAFAELEPFGAAADGLKGLAGYLVERKN
jgi:geranylgeranyl diphosphate synthase, type II